MAQFSMRKIIATIAAISFLFSSVGAHSALALRPPETTEQEPAAVAGLNSALRSTGNSIGNYKDVLGQKPTLLDVATVKNMAREFGWTLGQLIEIETDINMDLKENPELDSSMPVVILLAGGGGSRMQFPEGDPNYGLPKFLVTLDAGDGVKRSFSSLIFEAIHNAGMQALVVLPGRRDYNEIISKVCKGMPAVTQQYPLGTAHAALEASRLLKKRKDRKGRDYDGPVVIANSDTPLVTSAMLRHLAESCQDLSDKKVVASVLVGTLDNPLNPSNYGKVIIDEVTGDCLAIKEQKDIDMMIVRGGGSIIKDDGKVIKRVYPECRTNRQRLALLKKGGAIELAEGRIITAQEVDESKYWNSNMWGIQSKYMSLLSSITSDNSSSEYYITDIAIKALEAGKRIKAYVCSVKDSRYLAGVNYPAQIPESNKFLRQRMAAENLEKLRLTYDDLNEFVSRLNPYLQKAIKEATKTRVEPVNVPEGENKAEEVSLRYPFGCYEAAYAAKSLLLARYGEQINVEIVFGYHKVLTEQSDKEVEDLPLAGLHVAIIVKNIATGKRYYLSFFEGQFKIRYTGRRTRLVRVVGTRDYLKVPELDYLEAYERGGFGNTPPLLFEIREDADIFNVGGLSILSPEEARNHNTGLKLPKDQIEKIISYLPLEFQPSTEAGAAGIQISPVYDSLKEIFVQALGKSGEKELHGLLKRETNSDSPDVWKSYLEKDVFRRELPQGSSDAADIEKLVRKIDKIREDNPPVVVTLGGGGGGSFIAKSLKGRVNGSVYSVVNCSDDGGASGRLRELTDTKPPGDVTSVLAGFAGESIRSVSMARIGKKAPVDKTTDEIVAGIIANLLENEKGVYNLLDRKSGVKPIAFIRDLIAAMVMIKDMKMPLDGQTVKNLMMEACRQAAGAVPDENGLIDQGREKIATYLAESLMQVPPERGHVIPVSLGPFDMQRHRLAVIYNTVVSPKMIQRWFSETGHMKDPQLVRTIMWEGQPRTMVIGEYNYGEVNARHDSESLLFIMLQDNQFDRIVNKNEDPQAVLNDRNVQYVSTNPEAVEAIEKASGAVVVTPGSQGTSIGPVISTPEIVQANVEAKRRGVPVIWMMNPSHTNEDSGITLTDLINLQQRSINFRAGREYFYKDWVSDIVVNDYDSLPNIVKRLLSGELANITLQGPRGEGKVTTEVAYPEHVAPFYFDRQQIEQLKSELGEGRVHRISLLGLFWTAVSGSGITHFGPRLAYSIPRTGSVIGTIMRDYAVAQAAGGMEKAKGKAAQGIAIVIDPDEARRKQIIHNLGVFGFKQILGFADMKSAKWEIFKLRPERYPYEQQDEIVYVVNNSGSDLNISLSNGQNDTVGSRVLSLIEKAHFVEIRNPEETESITRGNL